MTAQDLCYQAGLNSTTVPRASVLRVNAVTGSNNLVSCGTPNASLINVVIGEAVMLRDPSKPISFIPAHF